MRTKLGGAFAGALLMGIATTLPEIITTISAVRTGIPQLAAGNLFGSNMFNILLLAVLDLAHYRKRISRKNAEKHALSGSLTVLMIVLALFFIIAQIPYQIKIGNFVVGADAMVMIAAYLLAMSLLRKQSRISTNPIMPEDIPEDVPTLRTAVLWFLGAIAVLVFVTPGWWMPAEGLRKLPGWGQPSLARRWWLWSHPCRKWSRPYLLPGSARMIWRLQPVWKQYVQYVWAWNRGFFLLWRAFLCRD